MLGEGGWRCEGGVGWRWRRLRWKEWMRCERWRGHRGGVRKICVSGGGKGVRSEESFGGG